VAGVVATVRTPVPIEATQPSPARVDVQVTSNPPAPVLTEAVPVGNGPLAAIGRSPTPAEGAHFEVSAIERRLALVVDESGATVTVAETTIPPEAPETVETTAIAPTETTEDFGQPRLWLDSFSSAGVAAALVPGDGRPLVERPQPTNESECRQEASLIEVKAPGGGWDRQGLAVLVGSLFECVTRVNGLGEEPATSNRTWDGAGVWGFANLAEQVASEAVVVAYCESIGFAGHALSSNNPWGYGGLFQMGSSELRRFGGPGASKFDPVDNTMAAARYFLLQYRNGAGWGGWSPWAVVNTNFDDDVNNQVKAPILPRFRSTDPENRGKRGPELPEWAVDPAAFQVPAWDGCPYLSSRWPASQPLGG
jgi:hypothetical protein